MRQFLVTKFMCAKCGGNLFVTYEKQRNSATYAEGEPTGAAMVEQSVAVEPCRPCNAPLEKLQGALATLKELV